MRKPSGLLLIRREHSNSQQAGVGVPEALLVLGLLVFLVPPMVDVARFNWSTEQGGHGPIVLGTGLWLLWREFKQARHLQQAGSLWMTLLALAVFLPIYLLAGITGILEVQVIAMYGALITTAYLLFGIKVLKACWFPLLYLAFALPPPDTVVAIITQPVKIAISQAAVGLLYSVGYPVGASGAIIQIAQFELLVAAACAGLNSLITLSAICLFYVYLSHRNDMRAFLLMSLVVVPVAVLANFVRVIILILLTYHAGEAAAQGFLHDFAGLVTFSAALASMLAINAAYTRFAGRSGLTNESR